MHIDGGNDISKIVKTERILRLVLLVRGVPGHQNAPTGFINSELPQLLNKPIPYFLTGRKGFWKNQCVDATRASALCV